MSVKIIGLVSRTRISLPPMKRSLLNYSLMRINKYDLYIAEFIEKAKTELKFSKEIIALTFQGELVEKSGKRLSK
ncbi:hypothetical protein K5Y32_11270 [Pantoea sp. DY-15]|uniref:hypothetical protein n=1 Tax=Pantoea sp. DY-15 TaxID=2871489 RepID=UPI001C98728A|nr:hypothetical protein [Pantoea sp. DY-15]MBY4888524.1 hypothetical protein [Pantoea sp. DY-15]